MAIVAIQDEMQLLLQLMDGNQRAFKKLFDYYHQPLASYVFQVTESVLLTEEIVQDVFVKIWLKREQMSEVSSLKDYLFILCRNRTIDALRLQAKNAVRKADIEKYLLEEVALDELDNPGEIYRQWISDAVAQLPPQQQKVYKLSRYERLKQDEIAAQLGLSKETVKKHMQLAIKFLEQQLKDRMDPPVLTILLFPLLSSM